MKHYQVGTCPSYHLPYNKTNIFCMLRASQSYYGFFQLVIHQCYIKLDSKRYLPYFLILLICFSQMNVSLDFYLFVHHYSNIVLREGNIKQKKAYAQIKWKNLCTYQVQSLNTNKVEEFINLYNRDYRIIINFRFYKILSI